MRRFLSSACLAAAVASCGGGGLTLAEYGAEVEGLTTAMYRKLDAVTISGNRLPTVEEVQTTYERVAEAYNELHGGSVVSTLPARRRSCMQLRSTSCPGWRPPMTPWLSGLATSRPRTS